MSEAAVHLSLASEETLSIHLKGKWKLEQDVPSPEEMQEQLHGHPAIKRIVFNTDSLSFWDSSLLIFVTGIMELAAKREIQVERDGLPAGVQQLIDLATAVPKKEDARKSVTHEPFFPRVGSDVHLTQLNTGLFLGIAAAGHESE